MHEIMKRLVSLGVVFGLLLVMAACDGGTSDSGNDPVVSNDTLAEPQNAEAPELQALIDAIKENPNDANNYYKRALYLNDNEQYMLAINDLKRALSIDSTVAVFHFEIADIYYNICHLYTSPSPRDS